MMLCSLNVILSFFSIWNVGPYFTAVDLADIARQLDEDERDRMAEGDVTSKDYQEFLKVQQGFYVVLVELVNIFIYHNTCALTSFSGLSLHSPLFHSGSE